MSRVAPHFLCFLWLVAVFWPWTTQGAAQDTNHALVTLIESLQLQITELQRKVDQGFSGSCKAKPRDCADVLASGKNVSKVYKIYPGEGPVTEVYCDMADDGGGWTVIQRRFNGSENFFRSFADYAAGFGNKTGEYWEGNENIHAITSQCKYELKIILTDYQQHTKVAKYSSFSVGDKSTKYALTIAGYSGDAGDGLVFDHNGHAFSTADADSDGAQSLNCAQKHKGGWWYSNCFKSNLNGVWGKADETGIVWGPFKDWRMYALKETTMMVRPVDCD
ncbi:fibrinogen C domain-containing protein 1-like [Saccostrea echinata]|uniref:fibrinogen C domain-containing protein 1-like n=1 Tax=Saccostrea echinata TaxID=191078 RepID=UPI002A826B07|nr:fibrinogen C domain-containing protein 1-like [Saccostrea echinata]